MSDSMTPEKLATAEIPPSTFGTMQLFLEKEGGNIGPSIQHREGIVEKEFNPGPFQPSLLMKIQRVCRPYSEYFDITVIFKRKKETEEFLLAEPSLEITFVNPEVDRKKKVTIQEFSNAPKLFGLKEEVWRRSEDNPSTWYTESEKEAQKIANIIIPLSFQVKSLSRRDLLKLIGIGVVLGLSETTHLIREIVKMLDDLKREDQHDIEPSNVKALREAIEKRFHIQIRTFQELSKEYPEALDFRGRAGAEGNSIRWNQQNLAFLEKALSLLPEHFLQPDEEGRKLMVILRKRSQGNCACGDRTFTYPYSVEVGTSDAHPTINFNENFYLVTHELTHLVTLRFDSGNKQYLLKQYEDMITKTIGGKFEEVTPPLLEKIDAALAPLVDHTLSAKFGIPIRREGLNEQEKARLSFLALLHYGIEVTPPMEFIAVLGEHYAHGKEYFFKNYSEFFDPETVEELYEGMKREIFRGREY